MKKRALLNLKQEVQHLKRELRKLPADMRKKIRFVMLFGSYAEGKATPLSDIDVAIYYDDANRERFKFQLKIMGKLPDNFDVKIYQDVPLFVQKDVLRGKVLYVSDMRFLYDVAYETIRRFEDFKNHYYDYISRRKLRI